MPVPMLTANHLFDIVLVEVDIKCHVSVCGVNSSI